MHPKLLGKGHLATLLVAIVATLLFCTATAAASSPKARIDAFISHHWPQEASGTVLVARGGRAISCVGLGWADSARQVPARCDTAYDLMSMTKQFTAAGILKLQMVGRLRVGDPIGRFIAGVPPDKRTITIAELLSQTSGLVESLGTDYEPLSRGQMLKRAMRSPLISPPGSAYHYSNVGFSVLAVIIEKASGIGYERFLRRHLFGPAGMWDTGYVLPRWRPDQVAVEYDRHGRSMGRPFEHPWAKGGPYWNLRGNGGLISTPRDMLRWERALLRGEVLSRSATRELFKPRMPVDPGVSAAFGWDIFESPLGPVAAHNGGNGWSFGVIARLLRQRVLVFWVSNHAHQTGRWNLERLESPLTVGLARRALGPA